MISPFLRKSQSNSSNIKVCLYNTVEPKIIQTPQDDCYFLLVGAGHCSSFM